ncbi:dynein axonemal assembly factor 1 homolog [Bactrocera dorsalis]|uniref:Dynein axonemal assembly factor 1 homolog n=1 Tax=Bactrocera dorsalis TaxID=27457 RepID=A0ABM3IZU4_BACDO|nr:dynein axonemal assembly factor 1 homolog [Bactrocera dorsalis]
MDRYYVGGDRGDTGAQLYNSNNNRTEQREIIGLTRITKKRLKELCKKDKLYQTPALNDVLYLHYQGIDCIECLEEYTGLKCLWLECNAISEIQGLDNQKQLKCLFLQSNLIKRIENLENCPELDTLNLASNHIRKIENCGFDVLPVLSTLNLSSNYLKDFDGLKNLENCKTLSVLDLSNNRIDDILVVKIFAKMPQLRVLVLQGNPVVSKLPQYRKTLILECKELTYLDSRPVFPKDRACAEAWKIGGYEGERKENERWNRMERKKIRDSVNATIRMRNRHKPPDQQDALFNSSDSDEDSMEVKRHRQAEVDAGINMELGIWEEVVNEDSKSETASSDMNVSSSTSVLSTTDSNANISADSKSLELQSNLDKEESKIMNDSITKSHVLEITKDGNMGNVLNICTNSLGEKVGTTEDDGKEASVAQKRVFIEEVVGRVENNENSSLEITSGVIERLLDNEILPAVVQKTGNLNRRMSQIQNFSDSDDAGKDEYNATVDAISKITMNDLSTPSPKKRIKLQIEVDECLETMDTEEEEQIITEKSLQMEVEDQQQLQDYNSHVKNIDEICSLREDSTFLQAKTAEQLKYEQECEEVNQKLVEDFEELSTHMDEFFVEMKKDKESVEKPQSISFSAQNFELNENKKHKVALEEQNAKMDALCKIPMPENAIAFVDEHVDQVEVRTECQTTLSVGEREAEENSRSSADVPPEASGIDKVVSLGSTVLKVEALDSNVPGDHADIPTLVVNSDTTEEDTKLDAVVVTPNFDRQQGKSISTFEREERELRQLLQKLEDENEQLYKINNAYRQALEKDIREEIKYRDSDSSENTNTICAEIIQDLLEELALLKQTSGERPTKPKSYEFGEIESDEEYSYSDPPKSPEPSVRSIREVLGSFNELLQEIARKNKAENEREECENREAVQSKYATTEAQKAESLQNLLKSPNLRDFNGDTSELLDHQIAVEKKRENARVRKLVDRVYAQKDKYNDTLEVVDGKLVVVKKDTGEIEDLPESKFNYSDSDDSDYYESANSDNEGGTESTRLWDSKVRREENGVGSFKLPYQPTERIPAMQLIQKANALKEKEDAAREAAEEEENEQFYSLEPTRPTSFHDIDEEFIDKMDFEKAAVENSNEDVVECTRSYTELKQIIKQDKEDFNLTEDENNILQRIVERVEQSNVKEIKNAGPFTQEENELLHKMVQRTKEKEKERKESRRLEEEARGSKAKPTLSKQSIKIMELNGNSAQTGESNEEDCGNFMNIKQLDAEFPIPRIFRDMLDETDMNKIAHKFHDTEPKPELTVLYSKQTNELVNKLQEGQKCGLFKNPLELTRGGIAVEQHCGEEKFHELDRSYEDVLPITDEPDVEVLDAVDECEELVNEEGLELELEPEPKRLTIYQEIDEETLKAKVELMKANPALNEKCESLRDVAVSVLKFDGSNYEEYGIDQETARGVVAYEKMLNFGVVETEDEFLDAPMDEEEMVKSVTEALQKNELKKVKDTKESAADTKTEAEAKAVINESEVQKQQEQQFNMKEIADATDFYETPTNTEINTENPKENTDATVEDNSKNIDLYDLEEMTRENMRKLENLENEITNYLYQFADHIQSEANDKKLTVDTKFSDDLVEYKDIPQSLSKLSEHIGDHHTAGEVQRDTAVTKLSDATVVRQQPETTTKTEELNNKPAANVLEKSHSLANLLKSPILKQFNDDTNESLDAQIQAAQKSDFELIECSLEVIGDDDEVVNEITVNAEITYNS